MEDGIAAGDIVWHGLPFTTHTELMDPGIVPVRPLGSPRSLDRRFGRKTIAAKMTDVPGPHARHRPSAGRGWPPVPAYRRESGLPAARGA